MIIDNVYEMNGYTDRQDYLDDLADNMGLDRSIVSALADMLGENEDFDGLVTSLQDINPEDFDY
jgi:DNA-binding MarR family transcriptional regulator